MDLMNHFEQIEEPPVFVVGAARSGTTWVFDILTSHPEVAGVFESLLFTPHDSLKALFSPAHFPQQRSGLGRLISRKELLAHIRNFAETVLSKSISPGHRFFVEKSPSHLFSMPFIKEIFPEARFVHVIRDGRDVNISVKMAVDSWMKDWKNSFGKSVKTAARAWHDAVNAARRHGSAMAKDYFEIRFENIHDDPLSAYSSLFNFCRIPYTDQILQDIFIKTDFSKNFEPQENNFRRGGRVGDWKHHFNIFDALQFDHAAGDLLVELGYEKNKRWIFERCFL